MCRPLADLTNLTGLELQNNSITDVSPLADLTNLTTLNLRSNKIADVSPLADLPNLRDLYLDNNRLEDVSLSGLPQPDKGCFFKTTPLRTCRWRDLPSLTELHLQNKRHYRCIAIRPCPT